MKPEDLKQISFAAYAAPSRALALQHLHLLATMPLSLLPSYLVQIQAYPVLFPVEQDRLRLQLNAMQQKPDLLQAFRRIALPASLEKMNWVEQPGAFVGALSAALWQSGQIDAYHRAAEELFAALQQTGRPPADASVPAPMLIAVIGQGTMPGAYELFSRLRTHGLYARKVDEAGAAALLTGLADKRATELEQPYAHWYVDGGEPWPLASATHVQSIAFPRLAPVTDAVLREMDIAVNDGAGPEILADRLRATPPGALHLQQVTDDPLIAHFLISLLTQGSGTQLYSTSFVQTAAVELIRRAQPQTLLLRFAPRRRPASMNDMLEQRAQSVELDAEGALVDADMAVYYAWLALQRQPGGERANLVVCVEGHGEAFVAGPGVTRGVESTTPLHMAQVLDLL